MIRDKEGSLTHCILSRFLFLALATIMSALVIEPAHAQSTGGGTVTPQQKYCPPDDPTCMPFPTNKAPEISWVDVPASGHYYLPTDSFTLKVSASDPDGSVAKVVFDLDGSTFATDSTSPYTTHLDHLSGGTHTVSAVVFDNEGRTTSTGKVTFYIRNSVVTGYVDSISSSGIVKGWACSTYLAQSIKVDVYAGGTAGGAGTFIGRYLANKSSGSSIDSACHVSGGSYRYQFQISVSNRQKYANQVVYVYGLSPIGATNRALSHSGNFKVPPPRPPNIDWTKVPTGGAYYLPTDTLSLGASASSADGSVTKVQFVLDGHVQSTDTTSPYAAHLSSLSAGSHTVHAVAFDNWGRTTSTAYVTFYIRNSVVTGQIDSMSSGGIVKGWACSTYLPQSIKVDVYAGGTAGGSGTFIGRYLANKSSGSDIDSACHVSGGSYRYQFQISASNRQKYAGQVVYIYGLSPIGATNHSLTHSGDFKVPPLRPPGISWTAAPGAGAYYLPTDTLSLGASASSADGSVTKVQFVLDGYVQSTDTTSPYTASLSGLAAGAHQVYARAYNSFGLSATTNKVSFNIRHSVVKGYIDGITASDHVAGWACSTYLPQSIHVDVYAGGPVGTGTMLGRYSANKASGTDIDDDCDVGSGSYRFSIPFTHAQRLQYGNQPIYIYGMSPIGGTNVRLTGSGTFMVPPVPPEVTSTTTFAYDELGRVIAVRDSARHIKARYQYDANGNVTKTTDALGHTTTMTYDALDRVSTVKDATSHVTSYQYDAAGRITKVTDPRNNATTYTYDGFGRLWERTSPDTGTTTYSYASDGQLQGFSRADGTLITYTYDTLGRPVTVNADGQLRHFAYDTCTNGIGRLCSASDTTGVTAYTYTPEGQIAHRGFTLDGSAYYALAYTYDGSEHLSTVTYSNRDKVTYHYQNGRVSSVTATVNGATKTVATAITYRPGDRQLQSWTAGNGLTTTYSHDADGRLTGIHVPGAQSLSFTYDAADRITGITNGMQAALTQAFTYDKLSRLTGVASSSGNESYAYDVNGNRTTKVAGSVTTHSAIQTSSNRLASVGGQAIGYDANGNTVSMGGETYHYDHFNRLQSAGGTTYDVNPEGQRLRKSGPLGTTKFALDRSGLLLAEYSATSGWVDYVYLGGRLIGRIADHQVYAVATDQVGRPEAVTNAAKAIVWQAQNKAFNRSVSTENITLNIGFPGQYYDAETGLWHNGFRDYDAKLGRYIESDPIGLAGGSNTYAYVGDNPTIGTDPPGLKCGCNQAQSTSGQNNVGQRVPGLDMDDWSFAQELSAGSSATVDSSGGIAIQAGSIAGPLPTDQFGYFVTQRPLAQNGGYMPLAVPMGWGNPTLYSSGFVGSGGTNTMIFSAMSGPGGNRWFVKFPQQESAHGNAANEYLDIYVPRCR